MTLYHGSEEIVYHPEYGKEKSSNDFGRGFYCTEYPELAGEWACKRDRDGFINAYCFDTEGLNILKLNDGTHHILHWLALLCCYRGYWQKRSIAEEAKSYLQERFLPDISEADVIIGYRADDSYFSFAQDFIMGTISLQKLSEAMRLGSLGEQIVLKSEAAFGRISYLSCEAAEAAIYFAKKKQRDLDARREYSAKRSKEAMLDEIYMIDIMRGRVSDDELFL